MAKTINLRITDEAEKFMQELKKRGISEQDAISKALWLLNLAHKTGRIALLKSDTEEVQYVFMLDDLAAVIANETASVAEEVKTEFGVQEGKRSQVQEEIRVRRSDY